MMFILGLILIRLLNILFFSFKAYLFYKQIINSQSDSKRARVHRQWHRLIAGALCHR